MGKFTQEELEEIRMNYRDCKLNISLSSGKEISVPLRTITLTEEEFVEYINNQGE